MWRAYTREKPARSGWAIPSTALMFAASVCFAYGITNRKNQPLLSDQDRAPADWPIAFRLPGEYTQRTPPTGRKKRKSVSKSLHHARFEGSRGREVTVEYYAPGTAEKLVESLLKPEPPDDAEYAVRISRTLETPELDWQISISPGLDNTADFLAGGEFEDGGIVVVKLTTPAVSRTDDRVFEAVLKSVQLRESQ